MYEQFVFLKKKKKKHWPNFYKNCKLGTTTLLWLLFITIYMRICNPHYFCCSQHKERYIDCITANVCLQWLNRLFQAGKTRNRTNTLVQFCQCLMLQFWTCLLCKMRISLFCPNVPEPCGQKNEFNETALRKIIFKSLTNAVSLSFRNNILLQKAHQCWRNQCLTPTHKNSVLHALYEIFYELALNSTATPGR